MAKARTETRERAEPGCEPHEHTRPQDAPLPADDETFERAAAFLRAAGDPARLKILARLSVGEWCVSELADVANAGLSTVSQQLRLLRAERLVKRHRQGKHILYRVADKHILRLLRAALEHAAHAQVGSAK